MRAVELDLRSRLLDRHRDAPPAPAAERDLARRLRGERDESEQSSE
jgi:hypothetical protein